MKWLFIILFCLIYTNHIFGQMVFEQNIIHGGVTGAGFSTGVGTGSGSFNIHIESGSTIKKAYLLSFTAGNPDKFPIYLNNTPFYINNIISEFTHANSYFTPIKLRYKDVTNYMINNLTNTFNVEILPQQSMPYEGYFTVYIIVIYENMSLPKMGYSIITNNKNLLGDESYQVNNLNTINTTDPVGFSLYTDRVGDSINQSDIVRINNNYIGTVFGSDSNSSSWSGAGVRGHFYYQNNQLFGLDDDTPDNNMKGSDGLADISGYVNNNSTSLSFELKDILYPNIQPAAINLKLAYFLTYTTPCDTFPVSVSKDTTICHGEQFQLHATGGTKYKWKPITDTTSNDLSCTTCPNPIFSGDSSQVYTVRIWNTDSCSVVLPVCVTVRPQPNAPSIQTDSTLCGTAVGEISTANNQNENVATLFAVSNGGDTLTTATNGFSGLPANGYTVFYSDTNGCVSLDTVVTINSFNTTVADFAVHPDKGATPLQVDIQNQSQNATDYSWWLNGAYQGNNFTGFLADTSGTYHIQLIAWNKDSICADTARLTVVAFNNIVVQIYNLVSPNKDGKNDTWVIKGITKYPDNEVHIFNRWGNVVFSAQDYQNDWGGKDAGSGKILPSGTYFYTIKINDKGKEKKLKGYLELVR